MKIGVKSPSEGSPMHSTDSRFSMDGKGYGCCEEMVWA